MRTKYQWGKGFSFCTVLRTAGSADIKSDPTLAAGDVKISKDGGAFANLATLPDVDPNSTVRVKVTLSDAECQASEIIITFIDTATKQWDDQILILSAMDAREGRVQYASPAAMIDRVGPLAANISKANKPGFYLLHTSHSSSSKYDFDTRLLMGAVIRNEAYGSDYVILGGYWFNDTGDLTESVFGIAKDANLFGCVEGATTTPYTSSWTDAANEATHGNGWTFICMKTNRTASHSDDVLEIYVDPNMLASFDAIGFPTAIDGGKATLAGNMTKLADDSDGAGYDATTDSLQAIRDRGDAAWLTGGGVTAQEVRNAMRLAPTSGTIEAGSVDAHLDTIETDTAAILVDTGTDIPASIAALPTDADVQTAATAALNAYDPPTNAELTSATSGVVEKVKDTLLNKTVITRHANEKPSQYTAGTAGNIETVSTTIDVNGNVETEVQA